MLISKQILVRVIVLATGVLNLGACGQTGSLYLPTRTPPVQATPAAPTSPTDNPAPTTP